LRKDSRGFEAFWLGCFASLQAFAKVGIGHDVEAPKVPKKLEHRNWALWVAALIFQPERGSCNASTPKGTAKLQMPKRASKR